MSKSAKVAAKPRGRRPTAVSGPSGAPQAKFARALPVKESVELDVTGRIAGKLGPATVVQAAAPSSSAVVRVLDLLAFFSSTSNETTLAHISEVQGLSRSVTHKLLQILVDRGLVECNRDRKTYRIGIGLYRLAATVLHDASFIQIARASMRELVAATGESACLNLLDRERAAFTVAAVEESRAPLQYVIEIGQRHPLHAGSSGKAILAYQQAEWVEDVLGQTLEAITAATPVDAGTVRRQLAEIRKSGYSLSKGERLEGAVGIAAPIIGADGLALGSVQLTVAAHRFERSRLPELRDSVIATARSISALAQAMPRSDPT